MPILTPTYVGTAAVIAVLVVALLLVFRNRGKTSIEPRPQARGPANLNYVCARCSAQVTHTKRTLAAWEKGSRKFFCNDCHKNWREAQPPREPQGQPSTSRAPEQRTTVRAAPPPARSPVPRGLAPARSGCFTVLVVVVVVPVVGFIVILSAYA